MTSLRKNLKLTKETVLNFFVPKKDKSYKLFLIY